MRRPLTLDEAARGVSPEPHGDAEWHAMHMASAQETTDKLTRLIEAYMNDAVNRPEHYTGGEIECIDAIRAALGDDGFVAYCRGNVLKYSWRVGAKDDAAQDIRKAQWYAQMAAHVLDPAKADDPRARGAAKAEPDSDTGGLWRVVDCDGADYLMRTAEGKVVSPQKFAGTYEDAALTARYLTDCGQTGHRLERVPA